MSVSMDPTSLIQSLQTIDQQLQSDLATLGGGSQQSGSSLGSDASNLAPGQQGGGLRDLVQALEQLVQELMQMEQQQAQQSQAGADQQAAPPQASPDQGGGAAGGPGGSAPSGGDGGGGTIGKIVQVLQQLVADVGKLLGGGGATQA